MSNDTVPVIKVKPWAADQGDYVEINEADFDPSVHTRFEEVADKPKRGRKPVEAAE
jgi:hypothetical protein